MELNNKQKKYLTIAGCAVLGLTLMAAIGSQFRETPARDVLIQKEVPGMEIVVAELEKNERTEESEIMISQRDKDSVEGTVLPAQTDQTEQMLQEEVTKPEEPSMEELQDPTKTPDGEAVEGEPEAVSHEEVKKPDEPVVKKGEPQAGDTKEGQIYIPGFGWVKNEGGGTTGSSAENMFENGNKIGIMD